MSQPIRLLIDSPLSGPENMARDEALLVGCNSASPPTLRLYAWDPPTISLGYFQEIKEHEALPAPAGELALVRRTTGGGAILHDVEVTYSIVIPEHHPLVAGKPNELYKRAHRAIIAAIGHGAALWGTASGRVDLKETVCGESARSGPFFCFARRHSFDVVLPDRAGSDWRKVAGSAQRRTKAGILQHGSIILDSRYPQQPCATWREVREDLVFSSAADVLADHFSRELGSVAVRDDWRTDELETAEHFQKKYAGPQWTRRI